MTDAQLVSHVDVEVADHDDPALGADRLAAAAELAGLHVALEDVDAVLLVEGDAGDLVEADHVVLGDEAAPAGVHVDEHVGDRRLAARDEVRVRRDLLEQVRLAGAARPELDDVVVAHDERHHPQQQDVLLRVRVSRAGSKPTLRSSSSRHCSSVKLRSARRRTSPSASRVDIWIGRIASTRNGWPPCSSASAAMYSSVTSA